MKPSVSRPRRDSLFSSAVGGEAETSELVIDLVAPGTETDLVVGFSAPPEGGVTFRLVGYEAP